MFPEDFPLVGAITVVVNQAVQGSSLGDKVSRLGLEAMQSIDLASSKSAGLGSFLENESQSGSSKGFEFSSKTELPGMLDSFRPSAAGDKKVLDPSFLLSCWFISHLPHLLIKPPILLQQFHKNLKTAATTLYPLILKFLHLSLGQEQANLVRECFQASPQCHLLPGTLESQIALSATFAEIDKRRLPMALVSKTNSFSTNNASQSLPHWLREFFKPEQTPLPKPATLSPTITVTAFLYKDCETSLPPFVHPGTLPTPPKNFSKRNKRQERNSEGSRVAGELDSVGGSEPLSQTLPNPGLDQLKMQTQFPAALPASLQQLVAGLKSSLTWWCTTCKRPTFDPIFFQKAV